MNSTLLRIRRIVTIPAAFGATLLLATFTYPGGLSAAYHDIQDYDAIRADMRTTRTDDAKLDAILINILDRITMKEQWLDELLAGRATLKVTTQRFMELNTSNEITRRAIDDQYAGACYEEKAARNVVDFVRTRLRTSPGPSNTPQRIQAEFREQFGSAVSVN